MGDPSLVLAYGTAAGAVLGALAALVDRLRAPGRRGLMGRVEKLERRFTGLVRWYHDQQVTAAAQGHTLAAIPPELLR